ncbi:MAG: hypothetical protein ABIM88_00395 [candidate division WOR-3 bacterium]
MYEILFLLSFSTQGPEGAYLPFLPQETLNVELIATWSDGDTSNNGCSVVARDGYVYLALGSGGLSVLDARYPDDSVVEVYNEDSVFVDGLQVKDTLLLARTISEGVRGYLDIFSIADPVNPQLIGRVQLNTRNDDKFSGGSSYIYIYGTIAVWTYSSWSALILIDISEPTAPKKLTGWRPTWNSGIYQVAFYPPKYLYCSSNRGVGGYNVLYILDVSDPANPVVADSLLSWFGVSMAIETYDHYLYCGSTAASVWDISDPLNPVLTDTYPFYDRAEDYFINPSNKRLYAVNHMYVFDISEPSKLRRVGEWTGDQYYVWLHSVCYDRGYIYCAGNQMYTGGDDLYILHYKYDTIIPPDTGDTSEDYLDWVRTVYGNPGLEFSLSQEAYVSFSLFNAAGLKAYEKDLGLLEPGPHTITLPGGLNPGVYVLFLKTNEQSTNRKIIFTKGGFGLPLPSF